MVTPIIGVVKFWIFNRYENYRWYFNWVSLIFILTDSSHETQTLQQQIDQLSSSVTSSSTTTTTTENNEAFFITQPFTYPSYFEGNNYTLNSNSSTCITGYQNEPLSSTFNYQAQILNMDHTVENYAAMTWPTYDTRGTFGYLYLGIYFVLWNSLRY